jgi:hypothetical protein
MNITTVKVDILLYVTWEKTSVDGNGEKMETRKNYLLASFIISSMDITFGKLGYEFYSSQKEKREYEKVIWKGELKVCCV